MTTTDIVSSISPPCTDRVAPDNRSYWENIRRHFTLEAGHSYLNNASLGLPPGPVAEAVARGFALMSANPTQGKRLLGPYIEQTLRPALAAFLGAGAEEVAFTRNATESLHTMVNGLHLQSGDRILVTTQEHPSALKPWQVLAERVGVEIHQTFVPSPPAGAQDIVDRLRKEIDGRTRVLFFCHVTRGGHLYPVKALCALAAEHGIVSAIDGAQAVGMFDVNLHDLGCDLYANSLHKWFLGPSGTGFLYVRREFQERFHTLYYTDRETPPGAQKYETLGTYDLPTRAALGTALDFLNRIGIHNIEPRLRMLSDYLRDRLSAVPRVRLCTSRSYEVSSPGSTIFEVEGVSASAWPSLFLQESGMHVDDHTRDGHTGMRISTHYYNSLEEIDRLMDKLKELIQRFPGYI